MNKRFVWVWKCSERAELTDYRTMTVLATVVRRDHEDLWVARMNERVDYQSGVFNTSASAIAYLTCEALAYARDLNESLNTPDPT